MKTAATLSVLGLTTTALASRPLYYKRFKTSGNDSPVKVFNDRGLFNYIHIDDSSPDNPDLHRFAQSDEISRPDINEPSSDYRTVGGLDYVADFSFPKPVPPTMFAGWETLDRKGIVSIYQGLKRTSLKQWSQVQILSPPDVNYQTEFGQDLVLDTHNYHHLAVGCPSCNSTFPTGGQVYLYSTPEGKSWSQSQVLELSASGYHDLGRDVQFNDNVLLASVKISSHGSTQSGYVGFLRGPGREDSYDAQQVFTFNQGDVTASAVYEETIILANQNAVHGATSNAGAVYVLYPSTERFGLKPAGKPRPVQWSVQQVLVSASPVADDLYGASVSIERDTLVVTTAISHSAFVYKREELNGKWSQQQVFTSLSGDIYSSSVAGSKIAVGSTNGLEFYSLDHNWDCLVVKLEDHFGDGWDIAELTVKAPDGTQDFFALSCEHANPLRFRYCPNLPSDGGLYSFSITDALKSKFYWEIQYTVFEEATGVWHRGKWDTKMDFHWDPDTLSFSSRKMDKIHQNSTCVPCKTRPTEKPTPVLRRALKGGDDHTHVPTVSPAPTLDVSNSFNWREMKLAGSPWFDSFHGTDYYISDPNGHRLIASGTMCPGEATKTCWVDLPKGDYTLRVGGALNPLKASNTFTYCKQVNAKSGQSQMMFRIEDDDCSVTTFASKSAVCNRLLGVTASYYLVLNFNLLASGASVASVTSAERTVFAAAFATIFPGVTSSDVTLVSASQNGDSAFINANVRISSASGFNLLDFDEETLFESYLKSHIEDQQTALSLAVALTSGSVASGFAHVSGIEFVDYKIVDSLETVPLSGLNPEVVSFADAETVSYSASSSDSSFSAKEVQTGSEAGYLLAGVGMLLAVGLFAFARSKPVHSPAPLPTESAHEEEEYALRQRKVKELSPQDLKELVLMEQEYLKIVSK